MKHLPTTVVVMALPAKSRKFFSLKGGSQNAAAPERHRKVVRKKNQKGCCQEKKNENRLLPGKNKKTVFCCQEKNTKKRAKNSTVPFAGQHDVVHGNPLQFQGLHADDGTPAAGQEGAPTGRQAGGQPVTRKGLAIDVLRHVPNLGFVGGVPVFVFDPFQKIHVDGVVDPVGLLVQKPFPPMVRGQALPGLHPIRQRTPVTDLVFKPFPGVPGLAQDAIKTNKSAKQRRE